MTDFPFYLKALGLFQSTQQAQIKKGLEKYPEPFNPHSWTPEQLLNHALEETVDLTHYLVGLKDLLDVKDLEIKRLKKRIQELAWEVEKQKPPKPVHQKSPFETEELHRYFDPDDQH